MTNIDRAESSPFDERYFIWNHAYAWTNNTDEGYASWFVELWFETCPDDRVYLTHPVEHQNFLAERAALDSAGDAC